MNPASTVKTPSDEITFILHHHHHPLKNAKDCFGMIGGHFLWYIMVRNGIPIFFDLSTQRENDERTKLAEVKRRWKIKKPRPD